MGSSRLLHLVWAEGYSTCRSPSDALIHFVPGSMLQRSMSYEPDAHSGLSLIIMSPWFSAHPELYVPVRFPSDSHSRVQTTRDRRPIVNLDPPVHQATSRQDTLPVACASTMRCCLTADFTLCSPSPITSPLHGLTAHKLELVLWRSPLTRVGQD